VMWLNGPRNVDLYLAQARIVISLDIRCPGTVTGVEIRFTNILSGVEIRCTSIVKGAEIRFTSGC